jgi:hypothetical protein
VTNYAPAPTYTPTYTQTYTPSYTPTYAPNYNYAPQPYYPSNDPYGYNPYGYNPYGYNQGTINPTPIYMKEQHGEIEESEEGKIEVTAVE